jgi:hypothetical protein
VASEARGGEERPGWRGETGVVTKEAPDREGCRSVTAPGASGLEVQPVA